MSKIKFDSVTVNATIEEVAAMEKLGLTDVLQNMSHLLDIGWNTINSFENLKNKGVLELYDKDDENQDKEVLVKKELHPVIRELSQRGLSVISEYESLNEEYPWLKDDSQWKSLLEQFQILCKKNNGEMNVYFMTMRTMLKKGVAQLRFWSHRYPF